MGSKEDGESVNNELKDQIRRLTNENVQLRDKNERLFGKLGELQGKLGQLAGSKTDLSSKLVFSEEEKLKISKDLIDLQIQTNKMREQYEAENFELKNKILLLENHMLELEMERDKLARDREMVRGRVQAVEKNHKELADEYIVLKSNYLALSKEHDDEVMKNDELSFELLSLAKAQDILLKQQESQEQSRAAYTETAEELARVRALVSRLSSRRIKPEELMASEPERRKLERSLLGNQDEIKDELEKMKKNYEGQQHRLEDKVVNMGKELQENRRAIRNTQHKLAQQSAALLSSQSQIKEVEAENSGLQLQLKELNEEYRARLLRYLQDIAEYVDGSVGAGAGRPPLERSQMKSFVDNMLKDVKASYKTREEQLASAARGYKKRLQHLLRTHESLLIAYRMQREQILALEEHSLDPGPPESHFSVPDNDLQEEKSRELQRLREDKARLETQLREAREQRVPESHSTQVSFQAGPGGKVTEDAWAHIRKQLREFTHSTQEDLERERAQLITRATVAEEQVLELQDYVDKHLARYKQEVVRLRKLLGTETGRALSADAPDPRFLRRSKRNTSYEL
ncbi:coiled-coil domain-containing protein 78 isoform X2 [Acipenser ruthenus]|uniref:coiled-coil domain-containing protein 78 isoform X2 n=1 Tax=Acipenser ruthenus TaxID=7906 RepID=UPI00145A2401|nr:coiled-coil domain-containing protein 78 isoform X2 [Acipenser ruthenus]